MFPYNASMNSETGKLHKTLSAIAGEYFVAAELPRHGMVAAVTLRNTRGVDIMASKSGTTSKTIQVKTAQKGQQWVLSRDDEKSKGSNHYFVFVLLNGRDGHP